MPLRGLLIDDDDDIKLDTYFSEFDSMIYSMLVVISFHFSVIDYMLFLCSL